MKRPCTVTLLGSVTVWSLASTSSAPVTRTPRSTVTSPCQTQTALSGHRESPTTFAKRTTVPPSSPAADCPSASQNGSPGVNDRIREELRSGKSAIAAIDAGFNRAMVAIADSQLTTLAAAVIMFWLGSGPIRGFAVTLSIGIFTSVFTAVTVTRLLVSLWLRSARGKSAKIEVPV